MGIYYQECRQISQPNVYYGVGVGGCVGVLDCVGEGMFPPNIPYNNYP